MYNMVCHRTGRTHESAGQLLHSFGCLNGITQVSVRRGDGGPTDIVPEEGGPTNVVPEGPADVVLGGRWGE